MNFRLTFAFWALVIFVVVLLTITPQSESSGPIILKTQKGDDIIIGRGKYDHGPPIMISEKKNKWRSFKEGLMGIY